jgi:hypothetical protein
MDYTPPEERRFHILELQRQLDALEERVEALEKQLMLAYDIGDPLVGPGSGGYSNPS